MSRLTPHVLKPNAGPVVFTYLSSAAHEFQRVQRSALFVVAEQEIFLNHDHKILQHECVALRPLLDIIMDLLLHLFIRAIPFFVFSYVRS